MPLLGIGMASGPEELAYERPSLWGLSGKHWSGRGKQGLAFQAEDEVGEKKSSFSFFFFFLLVAV